MVQFPTDFSSLECRQYYSEHRCQYSRAECDWWVEQDYIVYLVRLQLYSSTSKCGRMFQKVDQDKYPGSLSHDFRSNSFSDRVRHWQTFYTLILFGHGIMNIDHGIMYILTASALFHTGMHPLSS